MCCLSLVFGQGSGKIVANYSGNVMDSEGINSDAMDFSAVMLEGKIYFASSREYDQNNFGENNWKKNVRINVFQADVENMDDIYELTFSNVTSFAPIHNQFTHTGPLSFSVTGDTMFYTQVPVNTVHNLKKHRPQIFMLIRYNGKWSKSPQLLPFNNPLFSYGHPSFDSKTNTLYFSSDLKGGKGGKDIYYSQIRKGIWSAPTNMTSVNTSANELYPYYSNDKTLFFASDRELGKGGLDMYFKVEANSEVTNMEFVNSEGDDFGLFLFNEEKMGFLSSNRNGSDDVFTLEIKKEMVFQNNFVGKFEYQKLEEKINRPLSVYLLNEKKEIVSETGVNENGEFQFFNLEGDEDYSVMANSKDEMNLQVYDAEGKPSERLIADQYGDFIYELLDVSEIDQLNLMQVSEKTGKGKISGRFKYDENQFKETGEMIVNLINENGEVAYSVKSDKDGFFEFDDLPADENFIINLESANKDLTLLVFNKDDRIVEELKADGSGYYLYRKLKVLDLTNIKEKGFLHEDEFVFDIGQITGNFNVNGKEGYFPDGLKVGVYNDKGELVDQIEADEKGNFIYDKQAGMADYVFKIEDAPKFLDLNSMSLLVDNDDGSPTEEIKMNENGEFRYKMLKLLSLPGLEAKEGMDEGDFDFFSSIYGQVKYNDKDTTYAGGLEVNIYNSSNELLTTEKTSEKGEFSFTELKEEETYSFDVLNLPDSLLKDLMSLELKNTDGVVLSNAKLTDNGRFTFSKLETNQNDLNLKNELLEDNNFDLIYTIAGDYDYDDKDGQFPTGIKVVAYDGNGNKAGEAYMDESGNFIFERLPGLTTILFKLEGVEETFDIDKFSLFVKDENGKSLAKLQSSEKSYFVYKPLGYKVDIPIEIKEQMNTKVEEEIFGNAALDVSSDIESVYFGSNKTNPNTSDILRLEKMLIMLEISKDSRLEINAYADSRASDKYNLILSERRAQWIKNYMVKKGVESHRVIINAYGEGKLVNDCADGVDCADKEHALNRRAELRIIN